MKSTHRHKAHHDDDAPAVISMITLGCAKNLVDSERILGGLAEAGFLIAQDPAVAELCLVNTCGFINDAREETAGVLREIADLKKSGSLRTLVALGCLVERVTDAPEFTRFLEAADARLGFKDYPRLPQICRDLLDAARGQQTAKLAVGALAAQPRQSAARKPVPQSYNDFLVMPRMRIGSPHTAFLKISEGCSNPCRFCAIPRMRGLQVSRPIESIVAEAQELADGGTQELNLIAQDTTSYGRDLYKKYALPELLHALKAVKGPRWLRLLYAYPRYLNEAMLDMLASDERFCRYIDIPLQHIADPVLKSMARGVTKQQTIDLLDLIERKLPGCAIRTAFITGYPGETEQDFQELLAFITEGRFTHAGVFLYSNEPLTPAAKAADNIPLTEKKARREALMLAQLEVSRRRMRERVGKQMEVLVDGPVSEAPVRGAKAIGRTKHEAPEVDGVVYLAGRGISKLSPGTFVQAEITQALDYDVVGKVGQ
ncbi:MAG TPA: 30S ribosomal protein S12 methylthiotransferase RimO [Planctomycetota bacterium]|jgi:ribosomal protein S12 methylthiotransferase